MPKRQHRIIKLNDQVPEDARQEIKFVAFHTWRQQFHQWLRFHFAGFSEAYPERWVNNIYFDSHSYQAFEDNISGTSLRSKVRYRWYGELDDSMIGRLEIKRKRNLFVWKVNFPVNTGPNLRAATWREVKKTLDQQISGEGKMWLMAHPLPVIINRYRRQYYVSHDGKVRITLDDHQVVWNQRCGTTPNLAHQTALPDMIVVEAKFARDSREAANAYLQGIPARISRHSKYINGINAVSGNGVWL